MRPIVYLTLDGLLEPLGRSQVMRPLIALAERGFDYTVVSLERAGDLEDTARVAQAEQALRDAGVRWTWRAYRQGGSPRAVVDNVGWMARQARREVRAGAGLVHARSYVAATITRAVRGRTPMLFDTRGYWIDELAAAGRRVNAAPVYRASKAVERSLYGASDAIVHLTQLAVDDLRAGRLGAYPAERPALCIPTCAEYDVMRASADPERVPRDVRDRLEGRLVLAWVGSFNAGYATDEALSLVRRVLDARDDATLLVLSRQTDAVRARATEAGIPADRLVVATAPHEDMPSWLDFVDWGLMLAPYLFARRASMPTKLAEFFAMGVRPLQHGTNEEVDAWVERAGSGHVLAGLDDDALDAAAARVIATEPGGADLATARERTRAHFDLPSGADRYAELLRQFVA